MSALLVFLFILFVAGAAGGTVTVWLVDQIGWNTNTDVVFWVAAIVTAGTVLVLVLALPSRSVKKRREQWGREATLTNEIRRLLAEYQEQGELSGMIRFIGVTETSAMGPVYMVVASPPYDVREYAARDERGLLCFRGIPAKHGIKFVQPGLPIHYVPVEVANETVQMLNTAMAAPFAKKQLEAASRLVRGVVPWQAHGKLTAAGFGSGDQDPFRTIL